MLALKILEGAESGRIYPINRNAITLGRSSSGDVVFDDPAVSAKHCAIELRGRDLFVRDLGSTNGTFVNGKQTIESRLALSDILAMGGVRMCVIEVSEPPPAPAATAACPPPFDAGRRGALASMFGRRRVRGRLALAGIAVGVIVILALAVWFARRVF